MSLFKDKSKDIKNYFPVEYRHSIEKLARSELDLLEAKIIGKISLDECSYTEFCNRLIKIAKTNIGKYPNLEYLAAEIAYDNRYLDDLKFLAEQSNNPTLLYYLSMGYVELNMVDKAAEILKLSEKHIEITHNTFLHEYLLAKAVISEAAEDYLGALFTIIGAREYVDRLKDKMTRAEYNTSHAKILARESKVLLYLGRYTDAINSIKKGERLARRLKNRILKTLFDLYQGIYLIEYERKFDEGSKFHRRASNRAKKLKNPFLVGVTLETIGLNYKNKRILKDSLKFCNKAIKIFEGLGAIRRRRVLALNIAELYQAFGDLPKAEELLLDLEEEDTQDHNVKLSLVNLYIRKDDLEKAEERLLKVKQNIKGKGWVKGDYQVIFSDALIKLQSGNFTRAEELFKEARDYAKENQLDYLAFQANIQLVNLLTNINVTFPSKRSFTRAKDALEKLVKETKFEIDPFDYDSLELLEGILLFSNRDYETADEKFQFLFESFKEYGESARMEIVLEYIERIKRVKKRLDEGKNASIADINYATSQILHQNIPTNSKPIFAVKSEPKIFMVITDSGVPILTHNFEDDFEMDHALISGFISAIMHFSEELQGSKSSKGKSSKLQAIKHGGFEIVTDRKDNIITAIIAEKETYAIRRKLKEITLKVAKYLKNKDIYHQQLTSRQVKTIAKYIAQIFDFEED